MQRLCKCGVVADGSGHKKKARECCLNRLRFRAFFSKWGGKRDSNPRPSEPQSDALTN